MHSRREAIIRQVMEEELEGMGPEANRVAPVIISGTVVNVITGHATFTGNVLTVSPPEAKRARTDRGEQLSEMVHTLAIMESSTSSCAVSPESVWKRLKHALKLPGDKPIPLERQSEAFDVMLHRLTLARRDLQRDPETARKRAACYRYCHAIARQCGLEDDMRGYMASQWEAESMRDLEDEALWNLEEYLRRKAAERKAFKSKITRLRPKPERS